MSHWVTISARKIAAGFAAIAMSGSICAASGLLVIYAPKAAAQESHEASDKTRKNAPARKTIIEAISDTPPRLNHLHHVAAAKTPSGFVVPRYVSLKFGKINGRSGPSQNHPIVWQYQRRGLPVIVVAETENWRKVKDINGDESWVYRAGLSGERHVLGLRETAIYKKPGSHGPALAIAEKGTLMRLEKCEDLWCRVVASGGYRGWVSQYDIWGAGALFE
jgi:SH3-like domain-containing protein